MSEAYFEVLYPLWVFDNLRIIKGHQFFLGYHWLPLATSDLVGDNRELGSLKHILRSYTYYGWLIVSEH